MRFKALLILAILSLVLGCSDDSDKTDKNGKKNSNPTEKVSTANYVEDLFGTIDNSEFDIASGSIRGSANGNVILNFSTKTDLRSNVCTHDDALDRFIRITFRGLPQAGIYDLKNATNPIFVKWGNCETNGICEQKNHDLTGRVRIDSFTMNEVIGSVDVTDQVTGEFLKGSFNIPFCH